MALFGQYLGLQGPAIPSNHGTEAVLPGIWVDYQITREALARVRGQIKCVNTLVIHQLRLIETCGGFPSGTCEPFVVGK